MMEDKHGYIWIGTPKGVIQYNGYTPKVYGFEAGLPNDDVWELYEDTLGRIWTSSISNEIGYFYNNRYKKVVAPFTNKTLYPRDIREYPGGIMFYSTYVTKAGAVCFEQNDTLHIYDMKGLSFPFFMPLGFGAIIVTYHDQVFKITFNGNGNIAVDKLCKVPSAGQFKTSGIVNSFENYYLDYDIDDHQVFIFNAENCKSTVIDLDSISKKHEKVKLISFKKRREHCFYVITEQNVFEIDDSLRCVKIIPIKDLVDDPDVDGNKVTGLIDNDFWGRCVGTGSRGIFLRSNSEGALSKINQLYLPDFQYIGMTGDEKALWWNEQSRKLVSVDSDYNVRYVTGNYENAVKLVPYNKDTSLLLANKKINIYDNKRAKVSGQYSGYYDGTTYESPMNIAIKGPGDFYTLSKRLGVSHYIQGSDKPSYVIIDHDRYDNITYDNYTNTAWIYNSKKILILHNGKSIVVDKNILDANHVSKIEDIKTDSFGNVFIKDYDRLLMLNYHSNEVHVLFSNYLLNGADMELANNRITIAGAFGTLFCLVTGPLKVGTPVVYHNVKNIAYNNVDDMMVYAHKVLLHTDKGFYAVNTPADTLLRKAPKDQFVDNYKFLISYDDSLYNIKYHDTIAIDQKNTSLFTDIINPEGSGKARYMFRLNDIDEGYQKLNSNELHLPYLAPGKYYSLSLVAYDKVWKGKAVNIFLYIVPRWWQKAAWQRAFLFAGLFCFVFLVVLVAYVTRRIVTAQNIKRNLRLKLELNSVYSQINPHFVFNSLSTALFFIKKKQLPDAQAHITKFSKLLRAYIKSSRNKYITIAEEKENLRNYIELQQARFEDKFDYEIAVSDKIPETTVSIPALLLQPIVENAIDHGLLHLDRKGHLSIRFERAEDNNAIVCIVEDDGIGREKAKGLRRGSQAKEESYGDILINDLVDIFNKYEQMHIAINYIDKKEPRQGTIVRITIKNPHNG
jgi:two-component sensor histidine kinase